jgi:hypothetical protein
MQDQSNTDDLVWAARLADVSWAAGLFEGEGNWRPTDKRTATAVLGMCDRDVVERFRSIVGFGTIAHVAPRDPAKHRDFYVWSGSSARNVRGLIQLFWPYLGDRRRARATEILAHTENCPSRPIGGNDTCEKGHPYDYVHPNGSHRCSVCRRAARNAHYARNGRIERQAVRNVMKACVHCGNDFLPRFRRDQKYCSSSCQKKAWAQVQATRKE